MPNKISHKLALFVGACALSLAFAPNALAAGGGAGGGSHVGGAPVMSPMTARPMVAPMDHKSNVPTQDMKSHAPFRKLDQSTQPQPATTDESSHAPLTMTHTTRPEPVTGTRIPPSVRQQTIHQDPPPPGQGSVN